MSKVITAAVIQEKIPGNNKAANLKLTVEKIRQAAQQGAKLVVLQELHSTRYFCQTEDPGMFNQAEAIDGITFTTLAPVAAELDIVLVMSMFEKRSAGLYHNTAQVIDGAKGRVGIYRKMHIPDDPGYYEKFYFTPGDADNPLSGFTPIETSIGKLGLLICWDQWYPEAARLMAMAGAEFLIYPTAIGWDPEDTEEEQQRQQDAWQTVQRAHAVANGIPVLVANRTGHEDSPDDRAKGQTFWGHSFIAGCQGEILAQASVDREEVLLAELDMARSEDVRRIWPYFRDRRVDAYGNLTKRWID